MLGTFPGGLGVLLLSAGALGGRVFVRAWRAQKAHAVRRRHGGQGNRDDCAGLGSSGADHLAAHCTASMPRYFGRLSHTALQLLVCFHVGGLATRPVALRAKVLSPVLPARRGSSYPRMIYRCLSAAGFTRL
jgi:hypothetical protein